jgi:hypothetical protein
MSGSLLLEITQIALAFIIALPCVALAFVGMARRQRGL